MAINSIFVPAAGVLGVIADGDSNVIDFSRDAAGLLFVNGGAVPTPGGTPTVANTLLLTAVGQGGDDAITLDESAGALPSADLAGGDGDDTLTGGSGVDQLFGQANDDVLFGRGGDDRLFGGSGNDTLVGGQGADTVYGETGDDRLVWNAGDGSDVFEGGDGTDTAEINGGSGPEAFGVSTDGLRVRIESPGPVAFAIDAGDIEAVVVNMGGGADLFVAGSNLAGVVSLTVDGGGGADTIIGGNGADTLLGGDGNDFVAGRQGNDLARLGAGNDVFVWDPGDGNDVVEGDAGTDVLVFNGSGANEVMEATANGGRLRLTRDVGNIVMDADDVEILAIQAAGGADLIRLGNLAATDVEEVRINLAATPAGSTGDGQADTVVVGGTALGDVIGVFGAGSDVAVVGLAALVIVTEAEGANDQLMINAGAGDDFVDASALDAGIIALRLHGGAGDDTMLGSRGADVLVGVDGDDVLVGNEGDDVIRGGIGEDVLLGGDGNDVFLWNPGDGSDLVEGDAGTDRLRFNASDAAEVIEAAANGNRLRFTRDVGNVVMDVAGVEILDVQAAGGADLVKLGNLAATGATEVRLNLAATPGGNIGDGEADTLVVGASGADEAIGVFGAGSTFAVAGLAALVTVTASEGANDHLTINAANGDDLVDASALEAGVVKLRLNGGNGDDTILGSRGADVLIGGSGNDLVLGNQGDDYVRLGAGDDTFVWNPGDGSDQVEGEGGFDTLLFLGSGAAEAVDISPIGGSGRTRFARDVGNVVMNLNDVERIEYRALGGADDVVIADLTGTDVTRVDIDLSGAGGGGDGEADSVTIKGTRGADVFIVAGDAGGVLVFGLQAQVVLLGLDGAQEQLTLEAFDGDDVIDATNLGADALQLVADGGRGADVMLGSAGVDIFAGGQGNDLALLGAGDDVFVWNPGDGSDVIEGEAGYDLLDFNGSDAAEIIDIAAVGSRVSLFRDVANVTMDVNGVEALYLRAAGGADTIIINDLSGTDVIDISIDLSAIGGGGDGQVDTIIINATAGDDLALVVGDAEFIGVLGLSFAMEILGFEATDRLVINLLDGEDVLEASDLGAVIELIGNGGDGDDVLIGSDGADTLRGGEDDDLLVGGPGIDVLDGGPGDNLVFQDAVV
ncbi:beta strand repeat-containing protein [Falsiroseomonas sp.]|uniref:beta strand repeat-containing protein n=1 Tax=Falsiroseomonas sp. TaxID=2870721 RepID=UPI00356B55BC